MNDATLHSLPAPVGDRQLSSLWEQLCEEKRRRIVAEQRLADLRSAAEPFAQPTAVWPTLGDCRRLAKLLEGMT